MKFENFEEYNRKCRVLREKTYQKKHLNLPNFKNFSMLLKTFTKLFENFIFSINNYYVIIPNFNNFEDYKQYDFINSKSDTRKPYYFCDIIVLLLSSLQTFKNASHCLYKNDISDCLMLVRGGIDSLNVILMIVSMENISENKSIKTQKDFDIFKKNIDDFFNNEAFIKDNNIFNFFIKYGIKDYPTLEKSFDIYGRIKTKKEIFNNYVHKCSINHFNWSFSGDLPNNMVYMIDLNEDIVINSFNIYISTIIFCLFLLNNVHFFINYGVYEQDNNLYSNIDNINKWSFTAESLELFNVFLFPYFNGTREFINENFSNQMENFKIYYKYEIKK